MKKLLILPVISVLLLTGCSSNFTAKINKMVDQSDPMGLTSARVGKQKMDELKKDVNEYNKNSEEQLNDEPKVGGDRDEHGCLGPAGYSWCEAKQKCLRPWEEACATSSATNKNITYLVSKEETTKYCNGADMESDGYRKTINSEVVSGISSVGLSQTDLIKKVIALSTTGMCQQVLSGLDIKVVNGVVSIPPVDAWAGVSIVMCSCMPQAEVNLLRLSGITKVVWEK
jgi:hypothetical protein